MKILHIDTERTWRGGEQQMLYLAKGLMADGHECLAVCRRGGAAADQIRDTRVPVVDMPMHGEADLLAAARIAKLAKREGADILHAHTSHAHMLASLAKAVFRTRAKLVVHRRVDFSIHKLPLRLSLLKYRFGVDRYIAVSRAIRDVLIADGVPADRIDLVNSCTDLSRFENVAPADLRAEFGLPGDSILVGNVGFLVGHKDHANLVRAAALVREKCPNAHFIVVGDGELRAEIEALRDELGLHDAFLLAGFRSDVPAVLADFDVFAMSSKMEGFGGACLEAMAMHVPVVTTDAGGMKEYVEDGVNGRVVPARDPEALAQAILDVIEHPEQTQRLVEAGRRTVVEGYSIDVLTQRTLEVYRRAMG